MSKIVDLLTYKKKISDKKGYDDIFSSKVLSENFDTTTKEKIANTYILNPSDEPANLKKDKSENHVLPSHKATHLSAKIFHLFPWLISFLAVLLLLVNIA